MRTTPGSAQVAGVLASEVCAGWGFAELSPHATECTTALVSGAIAAGTDSDDRRVHLITSVSSSSLIIEVCDPGQQWPMAQETWEVAQHLAAQAGGEFGLVCGPRGTGAFIALPLPTTDEMLGVDMWALEAVTSANGVTP